MNYDSENQPLARTLKDRFKALAVEEILQAAEAEFAKSGLHAARMEAIAERAGVAVGTLYNHFKNRSALLEALLETRRGAQLSELDAALAHNKDRGFEELLQLSVTGVLNFYAKHAALFTVLIQSESTPHHGNAAFKELRERFAKLMALGVKQKVLEADSAAFYPAALMGILRGTLMDAVLSDRMPQIPQLAQSIVDLFLHGASREGR